MMAQPTTTTTGAVEVCQYTAQVRNGNAERQRRFRQSKKGQEAYGARKKAKRDANAPRLAELKELRIRRWTELNKYRALDGFGVFSGPTAAGVPRVADMKRSIL
jgi:hypothetical protein